MRTTHVATETAPRGGGFKFEPDRHYVKIQREGDGWPSAEADKLLSELDEAGDFAYRIEAEGRTDDGRKVTGDKRLSLISCTKEYAISRRSAAERESREKIDGPTARDVVSDEVEPMQRGASKKVLLGELMRADSAARKERRELLSE
jgi:hypothetical protein